MPMLLVTMVISHCFLVCRCMIDGRVTGSISRFLDRTAENKLQFQLESFKFQNANVGKVCNSKFELLSALCYIFNNITNVELLHRIIT